MKAITSKVPMLAYHNPKPWHSDGHPRRRLVNFERNCFMAHSHSCVHAISLTYHKLGKKKKYMDLCVGHFGTIVWVITQLPLQEHKEYLQ